MNPTVIIGDARLYHADCRDVLRSLPDNSVDSCVCDPPYALVSIVKRFGGKNAAPAKDGDVYARASAGFMGKQWDTGEVAFATEFWAEVLRVLKPGGHVVAFSGTRTYHRMVVAIEDAGFEIRDQLGWLYGSGFPKSHDVSKGIDKAAGVEREVVGKATDGGGGKKGEAVYHLGIAGQREYDITAPATDAARQWQGWGTALKPAWEPIVLARKPLAVPREIVAEDFYDADRPERTVMMRGATVAENVLQWGTGAINVDGCRVEGAEDIARPQGKDIKGGNWSGDGGRSNLTTGGGTGRWPANIVHDGSDEVVAAFPDAVGQQGDLNETGRARPTKTYFGDMAAPKPHTARVESDKSAARFFYAAKASRADREQGLDPSAATIAHSADTCDGGRASLPRANTHPTVKPTSLMQWLCRLVTPPGGVVLDPFMGSGSTGKAALLEGFRFIGCEREDEYMPIAEARIRWALDEMAPKPAADNDNSLQFSLFDAAPAQAGAA